MDQLSTSNIRPIKQTDLEDIKAVIDSSELFPSEYLDDMVTSYFNEEDCPEIWFTYTDPIPKAVVFCAPEKMTEGTYNLYLIAVRKESQGKGLGAMLMNYVEDMLAKKNVRVLLVETSGLPELELTRKFYQKLNYTLEATIRDFYAEGEDKIVFHKYLLKK